MGSDYSNHLCARARGYVIGIFRRRFREDHVHPVKVEQVAREYLILELIINSMIKITCKFMEKDMVFPEYVGTKRMKIYHYCDMLRMEILEFMSLTKCQNLTEIVVVTMTRELELETQQWKRKHIQVHASMTATKNFKVICI